MMNFLVKKFIPDYPENNVAVRTAAGVLSGTAGIFFNLLLFAAKLIAGILSNSIAIVADAFNNLSDAGSSIITMIGFRLAGHKADAGHPFGHGRIEYITGMLVSTLICIMGFSLARESHIRHCPDSYSVDRGQTVYVLLQQKVREGSEQCSTCIHSS